MAIFVTTAPLQLLISALLTRSRKRSLLRLVCKFLILTLVGAGCAAQGPHRGGDSSIEILMADPQLCPELREPSPHRIALAYVEIDEQGSFQDRGQVERALDLVGQTGKPKYVVVFVHGWFHSAGPMDANVQRFKCALTNLQNIEGNAHEDVIGIYVGWRGESWTLPGIRYATFWDRKNTSDEIGRGSLVEFLTRLERATKPEADSSNKLMVVGHSFGASVVFNSIGQILLVRFLLDAEKLLAERRTPAELGLASGDAAAKQAAAKQAHPQSKPGLISGYGDLVILINPAIEATRIVPFFGSLNEYTNREIDLFVDVQPPRLVILSSEGDWATRKTFPTARVFSTLLESYQDRPLRTPYGQALPMRERHMDWQTMGNVRQLQTHEPLKRAISGSWDGKCPTFDREWLSLTIEERKAEQRRNGNRDSGAGWSHTFEGTGITLTHRGATTPSNPLWIMAVDRNLLPSHSGIANPILICFFDGLLGDPKRVNQEAERLQQQR